MFSGGMSRGNNTQEIEIGPPRSEELTGERTDIRATFASLVSSHTALVWVLTVAAAVAWRPLVMGFYADDWDVVAGTAQVGAAFSWARLLQAFHIDMPRIGMFPLWFLFSSLFSDEKLLWHFGLLIGNLAVVVVLVFQAATLTKRRGAGLLLSTCVALSWIILPWNAPLQFWPTMLPSLFMLVVFALSGILLWKACNSTFAHFYRACVLAGLLYFWACISYEVFYFQFLPVLLLLSVMIAGRWSIRRLVPAGASLLAAQAAAVVWYFVAKRLTRTQRPIVHYWYHTLGHNLVAIPQALIKSTWETRDLAVVAAAIWFAYSVYVGFRAWRSPADKPEVRRTLLVVLICWLGSLLSIAAYSMGNRSVDGVGVDARTFFLFSFWLILAVCLVINFVATHGRFRRAYLGVTLILGFTLLLGNLQRALDWSRAWRLQQQILAEAPLHQIKASGQNARILLVNPTATNGAPVFLQFWSINSAMHIVHPSTAGQYFFVYNPWLGSMVWDGKRLSYPLFPGEDFSKSSRPLYVWIPQQVEYWQAGAPFQISPDMAVHPLNK